MRRRRAIAIAILVASGLLAAGSASDAQNSDAQRVVAELKQSIAANRSQLMKYQWLQTTEVAVKGETKNTEAKKLASYNVNTYLDDPKKDVVTLSNNFAALPDGTSYLQQTVLDAKSKQLQVTTANSNYSPVGP